MPTSTLGQRVEHAHLAFTLAVHRALSGSGTACWSPYSVASALGLVATGARGVTQEELATLLVGSTAGLADHGAMLGEAASLPSDSALIGVANTLWHATDLSIRQEFLAELAGWPNPAVHEAPFHHNPEQARELINADVAETTHDLIPQLLVQGTLKPDTVAVLVNALYLKVDWRNKFLRHNTSPAPFHGPSGASDVPTMQLEKRLGYAAASGWQVVVLPAFGDVDAVILLPDGDIEAAESTLDVETLSGLLDSPQTALLRLFLPKFTVRARAGLKKALRTLGVQTMFDERAANFSGITRDRMYIDSVVHEAVLDVNEQGLEGAAATAATARALSMARALNKPIEVRVDRPFLFLVRHNTSGAVYFLARVVRP